MIPLRMHIKNFLSYGASQTINFEPYNLICLSGKNGHGKSALLDALTWAIWGQARKTGGTAKADEGLMHLGETHMMVSLDLLCNNVIYRIRREYALTPGKSYTTLEFGIYDPATANLIRPLTDKTIRATQAKIESILGLDYETFINSAFLRQGQSHEFSKKTPKERKDILATILGLDHFEQLRRLALEKLKDATQQKEHTKALIEQLRNKIVEKQNVIGQLEQIATSLAIQRLKEEEYRTKIKTNQQLRDKLAVQRAEAEKLLFQKQQLEKSLNELKITILQDVATYRRIMRQERHTKAVNYEHERAVLQTELQTIQFHAAQKIQMRELYSVKQDELRNYIQSLSSTHTTALEKIQFTAHTNDVALAAAVQKGQEIDKNRVRNQEELKNIERALAALTTELHEPSQENRELRESALERGKAYYHSFLSTMQRLTAQLAALEHKKLLMHDSRTTQCPLCEQQVTDTTTLEAKFAAQENLYKHQRNRLLQVTHTLKKKLIEDHGVIEVLKKKAHEYNISLMQKTEYAKNKEKCIAQETALTHERQAQQEVIAQLTQQKEVLNAQITALKESFKAMQEEPLYAAKKSEVDTIALNLEKIPYNPTREKQIHERLQTISQGAAHHATFLKESAYQEERKRLLEQKFGQAYTARQQIQSMTSNLPDSVQYRAQEEELVKQEALLQEQLQQLIKEKELLIHQQGALEAQKKAVDECEMHIKTEEEIVKKYTLQADEYTTLAAALGKDGIQALLIEDALPEIEQEANKLLSQLTDNQAHISIESLRDLKSGKAKETLDIKISDSLGIRPYEVFSGGEAFRIDFALRIALSKLLARRAGTALQTLIIDEGFGSQDEEGLAHIVDALTLIQQDFAKIIVVSHLPTLKEQFPIHFLIQKMADGSTVTIVEHC